ncbi:synaptotagmin-like protein 2 isoform X5 [Takifugu flavidus]|uniref:synaptotagmin-like protein 2 isoform X5 n=1 Tax=Takifugu flavidus TaxID=433684 RepID=UPI0025449992|nr:synaptotagmin-like protein 2 isoform X5 [Takifugu flavidus]
MIDLSHLTEEEQGAIMTVLRRDAELKRAEDDRVSKLEKTHNTGSKPDSQWKYLSGEWFYEAKSRRHMDKIHGSEVILASMKAQKAPFDGSPLSKRSPTPSSSGLKVGTPPKPARSLENLQLAVINDPEKEKKSPIFSPRMPRKNPFNQGSMIIYEAPDNISFVTSCQKPELSQTADASLLRSDPGEDFSQTSDTSSTSEGSSPAFRPVPRKRTFLSRHPSSSDPDAPVGPASIVPSPGQRRQLAQRVAAPQESPQQPMNDDDQPVYSEDKYGGTPSQKMDSSDTESGSDADVALEERREEPQDERLGERAALRSDVLRSSSIQDTVGGGDSAGPAGRPDELSLPQSTTEIQLRDESSRTPKSEADLQTRYSPGSYSGNKSYVDNPQGGDDTLSPVRKALMRAETRSKSLEDLTASPVQERRQDTTADIRGASDVSSMPSPASSLFSDKDHLKNMSKSVPLFLQKEDDASTDSNSDQSYHSGQLTKGGSLTNLTSSSGLSSLSGSMMTMYGGDLEVQGNIMFSINYIQKLREFHIFVAQCQDLAAADLKKGRSNPYVKSYLVPDKSNLGKRKTSVKKKTLNPTFNEILRYRVNMEYLRTQTLILSVWHHDTFGRNSFLGEVDVDLFKWDFGHTRLNYFPLKSRTPPNLAAPSGRGQLKLAIRYLPQISHSEGVSHFFNGEIHIWVKECRDLPLIRATINPYVKCFVLPDTSRKSRQKTRVVRRAVDPVFNHTMVYDGIRDIDLTEACVELTVWDRDKLATNLLGGLRLGIGTGTSYGALVDWMDSTPSEVALWERMKSTPNEWVEDVLPLRILNPARATFK